jgi:hypothetical protein
MMQLSSTLILDIVYDCTKAQREYQIIKNKYHCSVVILTGLSTFNHGVL